jgi:phosphoribosylamine---glycine ligase
MKILLIDASASFIDFAIRLTASGHEVRVFIGPDHKGKRTPAGDGLITKIPDWKPSMKWADLIITSTNAKYLKELEGYRKGGFPIWGCNVECASWELQRDIGVKIFDSCGIPTIPSILFKSYPEAIAHLEANPDKRYVSKPLGDADRALSYVSKSSRDLRFMLTEWQKHAPRNPFIFQEFHKGIEVAVGGWVGRNGFLGYALENFEHKKFMNSDVGPNTGEMGTVMKYVPTAESELARKLLLPLEAELIRSGYTGYIDVAVIVDKKGNLWPLEFTTRPGWPLFPIQQVLHRDLCQWMLDAINGRDTFQPYEEIAVGVVCAIKDFPYDSMPRELTCGFPVWGLKDSNRYFFHPEEMMLGRAPELVGGKLQEVPMMVTAGSCVGIVSGVGDCVEEAIDCAYATLGELEFANSPMYRTDIGQRVLKQLPELQKLGYMTSWEA